MFKAIISTVLLYIISIAAAFACGSEKAGNTVFLEVYDGEMGLYFVVDYQRGVGKHREVMSGKSGIMSIPIKIDFTLSEKGARVEATVRYEFGEKKKKVALTGKTYGMYRCANSPGYVKWDTPTGEIPEEHKGVFQKYVDKTLDVNVKEHVPGLPPAGLRF
ncbi:hypothetical protein EXS57_02125 [Candidatus Kaiserbacteria bacterium]|nr:hypothetical protein [Candidatus Kaiserbacteria bacterium]